MDYDLSGKTVLITGGTRGIGLATGLAFGARGARCVLTHRWGSADEDAIRTQFGAAGAAEPLIVEADVGNAQDTEDLMEALRESHGHVDVFISNAAFAAPVPSLDAYVKRDFLRAIEYTTWPMAAYTKAIHAAFNRYPRYVIGLSSPGHEKHLQGYDAVAMAKSMLETMCKYLAVHLRPEGVNVNVVRAGLVDTAALSGIIGESALAEIRAKHGHMIIPVEEVANAILALCSGLLDGVNGAVLHVDRGSVFADSCLSTAGTEQQ